LYLFKHEKELLLLFFKSLLFIFVNEIILLLTDKNGIPMEFLVRKFVDMEVLEPIKRN